MFIDCPKLWGISLLAAFAESFLVMNILALCRRLWLSIENAICSVALMTAFTIPLGRVFHHDGSLYESTKI
jgi:hypothetical protein